ncbi:hypothetical protein D9M68_848630 [compost metagenome]
MHGESPGQRHALRHAAGQLPGPGLRTFAQADPLQPLQRQPARLGRTMTGRTQGDFQVLAHSAPGQQARLLEHQYGVTEGIAVLTALHSQQAGDQFQQAALAGAAWSEDADALAGSQLQVEAVQHTPAAQRQVHCTQLKHGPAPASGSVAAARAVAN